MNSLNVTKGATISDLEGLLTATRKLLKDRISDSPKAGLVIAKGKPNEAKFRYVDLLLVLDSLEAKLSMEGCLSLGVCKTCGKFNPKVSGRGCFGACGDKIVHEYDSCGNHTKKGGCYGL